MPLREALICVPEICRRPIRDCGVQRAARKMLIRESQPPDRRLSTHRFGVVFNRDLSATMHFALRTAHSSDAASGSPVHQPKGRFWRVRRSKKHCPPRFPRVALGSHHHRQCPLLAESVHAGSTLSLRPVEKENLIRVSLGDGRRPGELGSRWSGVGNSRRAHFFSVQSSHLANFAGIL
jgi:hypothetical protein